jgi:hypothetical protein
MPTIIVDGDESNNTLIVTALGPDFGSYQLDGGPPVVFNANDLFVFNGMGGNDTFIINNPVSGLFAPVDGIFYTGGGQHGDNLRNLDGIALSGSYSVGGTPDTGAVQHTNGVTTQIITFNAIANQRFESAIR